MLLVVFLSDAAAEGVGDVGQGYDLVLAIGGEPYYAAGYDGDSDVLQHEGIETKLYGIEAEVFFYEVIEGREQCS